MLYEVITLAKPFNFLTLKPMIYMANISEEDLVEDGNQYVEMVRGYASSENALSYNFV